MTAQLGLFTVDASSTAPASGIIVERALTLHQPWATVIAHHGKRLENRPWKPFASIIGKRIALHAGKVFDPTVAMFCKDRLGITLRSDVPTGAIVAIATVQGFVTGIHGHKSEWYFGPYAWELADVIPIDPVPCKGAQGLWSLPLDVRAEVEARAVAFLQLPIAVGIVVRREGRFAAIRSSKHNGAITVLSGKAEPGETPEQAAVREAMEEGGLGITNLRLIHRMRAGNRRAYLFLADSTDALRGSDEGEAFWATREEILAGLYGVEATTWMAALDEFDRTGVARP